jgi:hypothetical protein
MFNIIINIINNIIANIIAIIIIDEVHPLISFFIPMDEVHELSIHHVIRKVPKKFPWNILRYL